MILLNASVSTTENIFANVLTILVALIIGGGFGYGVYKSFKQKGYLDIKSIKKLSNSLLNDTDIMEIINKTFSCENVDFSKYDTLSSFLSDQIENLENELYNYIQNNYKINSLIKTLVTRENISGVVEYLVNKSGFDIDLLKSNYNDYLETKVLVQSEENNISEDESNKNVVEQYYDNSSITKKDIRTIEKQIESEDQNENKTIVEFIETNSVDFSTKTRSSNDNKQKTTRKRKIKSEKKKNNEE